MHLIHVYHRLPVWLQDAATSMQGLRISRRRYDRAFREHLRRVSSGAFLSPADLRQLRHRRLGELLKAASNTPFWRERFAQYGVNPSGTTPEAELQKLPILTKAEAKEHAARITNPAIARRELLVCQTSGTTGSGLRFSETRSAERERWATWWRYRLWHGVTMDTWCGHFSGQPIAPISQSGAPFWRRNVPGRQLFFSIFHLSQNTVDAYVSAIGHHGLQWLHGYPSALALLAGFMADRRLTSQTVRVITTGAESLLPHHREVLRLAFPNARVAQHYGQAESVANISECPAGRLHVDEDFSFVEFVDSGLSEASYRILGSNWSNPAFPLLRYDTGDLVGRVGSSCDCGNTGRVVEAIDGRKEDYVLRPNGAPVGRLDHIFKSMVHVREAQIYQPAVGQVVIRVVRGPGYGSSNEETDIIHEAGMRLGRDTRIQIEYVDHLHRSPSGKLKFVVSDVRAGIPRAESDLLRMVSK